MGVLRNHQSLMAFSIANHPFLGYPHLWNPPNYNSTSLNWNEAYFLAGRAPPQGKKVHCRQGQRCRYLGHQLTGYHMAVPRHGPIWINHDKSWKIMIIFNSLTQNKAVVAPCPHATPQQGERAATPEIGQFWDPYPSRSIIAVMLFIILSRRIWIFRNMVLSVNGGTPKAGWFIKEDPTKMDDDWGYPYFWKPPHEYLGILPSPALIAQSSCHRAIVSWIKCWHNRDDSPKVLARDTS